MIRLNLKTLLAWLWVSAGAVHASAAPEPSIVVNHSQLGVTEVAISANGAIAATGSIDEVDLWSVDSGRLLGAIPRGESSIALSPEGNVLAIVTRDFIKFYRTTDRQYLSQLTPVPVANETWKFEGFLSENEYLLREGNHLSRISLGATTRIQAGNIDDQTAVKIEDGVIYTIKTTPANITVKSAGGPTVLPVSNAEWSTYSPRYGRLLAGGQGGASLWDIRTKSLVAGFSASDAGGGQISGGVFSADGARAILARGSVAEIINADTGAKVTDVPVSVKPDYDDQARSDHIAVASGDPTFAAIDNSDQAAIWSGRTAQLQARLGVVLSAPNRLLPLGTQGDLLLGGPDMGAARWDINTGTLTPGSASRSTSLTSDKTGDATAWQDDAGNIVIRREAQKDFVIQRDQYAPTPTQEEAHYQAQAAARGEKFSPAGYCGSNLAMSSDGKVLFALAGGRLTRISLDPRIGMQRLFDLPATIAIEGCLSLSPDDREIALPVERARKLVMIVSADDGHFISAVGTGKAFSGVSDIVWAPSGDALVLGEQNGDAGLIHLGSNTPDGDKVIPLGPHLNMSGFQRAAFSPDGQFVALGDGRGTIRIWDPVAGAERTSWHAHTQRITALTAIPGRSLLMSAADDGLIKIWTFTGQLLATVAVSRLGEWLVITPKGYFFGSKEATKLVSIVDGSRPYAVEQFFDALARKDLVIAALSGDPQGTYQDAATRQSLRTIIDSGAAPELQRVDEVQLGQDSATFKVRVTDAGGGVGSRFVWRVNGVAQGELELPPDQANNISGSEIVTRSLKLDLSKRNIIDVVAFNKANMLASLPLRVELDKYGETTSRPKIHLLAVGISTYASPDLKLDLAAADATDISAKIGEISQPLYNIGDFKVLTESDARFSNIEAAVDKIASDSNPQDVFIMYLAGHGRSIGGTYYFVPQDIDFAHGQTIAHDAISQEILQTWLARIPATKSLIILDTCESSDLARSSAGDETALERLEHATGRSVITASATAAREGYQGHGLLTGAILQAFSSGVQGSSRAEITVQQLANFVYDQVPRISSAAWGVRQQPHVRVADDFPLGTPENSPSAVSTNEIIPAASTHVVIREENVRELPNHDAAINRKLEPGFAVRVLDYDGEFAIVARDGVRLGYFPKSALTTLQ